MIIKSINAGKTVFKIDYAFDEAFNISDEIDDNHHELHKYNPRNSNMINRRK